MMPSSRLLRKKQPVNYKPTPLNRCLSANDISGAVGTDKEEGNVSPNHRDKVVTEDGRVFFPCPYCSRAFSEHDKRAVHLNTCPAKSYILSVANAGKIEGDKDADGSSSSQTTVGLLEQTHSFSEEEQRAFMRAFQLAKVNEIISENNYNMVINRLGQRKRVSQKVKSLIHSPSYLKSYHLDVSPNTGSSTPSVKPKSALKKTIVKKEKKPVTANKSTSDSSLQGKSVKKSKSVATHQNSKQSLKKSVSKKVRFAIQTPKRGQSTEKKSKPPSDKNAKKITTAPSLKVKFQAGKVSSKNLSTNKKVSVKAKGTEPKTKSAPKKNTVNKKSAVKVKAPGKIGVAKSSSKSQNVTKMKPSNAVKNAKTIVKQSQVPKDTKKVTVKKTNAPTLKDQKPKKVPPKKQTVSKKIVISPSTDMNALEMKLADLVNLISDGNSSGSPRLSLTKDKKTGSLVITSESPVSKTKTSLKRAAQDDPVPAKKKKTNDKARLDAVKTEVPDISDIPNVDIANREMTLKSSEGKKDSRNTIVEDPKETKPPLVESVSVASKTMQADTIPLIFEDVSENHSEIKENKRPQSQNKLKKETKKNATDNKTKSLSDSDKYTKKKTSLPKIVLKTVSGKKNAANTNNKNKSGSQSKKVSPSKAKVNSTKTEAPMRKTKRSSITKPVAKRVMERTLKNKINKIIKQEVQKPDFILPLSEADHTQKKQLSVTKVTTKNNRKRQAVKTDEKVIPKRVSERNVKQTMKKTIIPNVKEPSDLIPISLSKQVAKLKQEEQSNTIIQSETKTQEVEISNKIITKPTVKRIMVRNLNQTSKMIIPNLDEPGDIVALSVSKELDNSKQEKQSNTRLSVIKAEEVQTQGQTIMKPPAKRIMVRNLQQANKMVIPNADEKGETIFLPLSKEVNNSKQEEQRRAPSIIKTQKEQTPSLRKKLLHNRKTVPTKMSKPSNRQAAKTSNSPSKTAMSYSCSLVDLDVVEVPDSVDVRTTRNNKEIATRQIQPSPKKTPANEVGSQQKSTQQIIKIDEDVIVLEDDVIELDVEIPEHLMKETRTSKKPLTDEELLSLLSLDNDTEVEYIVQKPVDTERSNIPSRNPKIQAKSQESLNNSTTIHRMSAKQKIVAKPVDNARPSTSRIDQTSLIQELILNNIPRDDLHPRKLESYIKQFAAAVNAKELSERASSDVEIIEDDAPASSTNPDVIIYTVNQPEQAKDIVVLSDRVLRTEEEGEGEEMDPLLLEDEEEDEINSSVSSQSSIATMGPATCKYCLEVFENPIELLRHKRQAHTYSKILLPETKVKEYIKTEDFSRCPICEKPLMLHPTSHSKNKWSYIKHLNTHNKDMHFTCSKCNKKFKRHDHMKVHEKRHF